MADNVKIVVTVPEAQAQAVRQAMGEAGAGMIGDYAYCSFSTPGVGSFVPLEGANPAVGEVGKLAFVDEERIEVTCAREHLTEVIAAIKRTHPYEQPVIDVYPLVDLDYMSKLAVSEEVPADAGEGTTEGDAV